MLQHVSKSKEVRVHSYRTVKPFVHVLQQQVNKDAGIINSTSALPEVCFSVSLKKRSISSDEVTLPCTAMAFPPARNVEDHRDFGMPRSAIASVSLQPQSGHFMLPPSSDLRKQFHRQVQTNKCSISPTERFSVKVQVLKKHVSAQLAFTLCADPLTVRSQGHTNSVLQLLAAARPQSTSGVIALSMFASKKSVSRSPCRSFISTVAFEVQSLPRCQAAAYLLCC